MHRGFLDGNTWTARGRLGPGPHLHARAAVSSGQHVEEKVGRVGGGGHGETEAESEQNAIVIAVQCPVQTDKVLLPEVILAF
jgi:hypothetical protein